MFDDEFMNDMLLNPDLYGMEDGDDQQGFAREVLFEDADDDDENDDE